MNPEIFAIFEKYDLKEWEIEEDQLSHTITLRSTHCPNEILEELQTIAGGYWAVKWEKRE